MVTVSRRVGKWCDAERDPEGLLDVVAPDRLALMISLLTISLVCMSEHDIGQTDWVRRAGMHSMILRWRNMQAECPRRRLTRITVRDTSVIGLGRSSVMSKTTNSSASAFWCVRKSLIQQSAV
jgi:hypothetical protein